MTPEQHAIAGSSGEYIRTAWVVPGPSDSPHRLGLFLDAELYLEKVDVLPVLSGLQASGAIPAMTWLFVSHASAADRQTDYLCDKRFARFIAEDCEMGTPTEPPHLERGQSDLRSEPERTGQCLHHIFVSRRIFLFSLPVGILLVAEGPGPHFSQIQCQILAECGRQRDRDRVDSCTPRTIPGNLTD